jgi:hypothetical protein
LHGKVTTRTGCGQPEEHQADGEDPGRTRRTASIAPSWDEKADHRPVAA